MSWSTVTVTINDVVGIEDDFVDAKGKPVSSLLNPAKVTAARNLSGDLLARKASTAVASYASPDAFLDAVAAQTELASLAKRLVLYATLYLHFNAKNTARAAEKAEQYMTLTHDQADYLTKLMGKYLAPEDPVTGDYTRSHVVRGVTGYR